MLRTIAGTFVRPMVRIITSTTKPRALHHLSLHGQSDAEIECRFIEFFNRADIDGWDLRQGLNDLAGMDMVPNPDVCTSVLFACRRINDYAVAVRFLELVKDKCGGYANEVYPYVIQEIRPVLQELGIDTPEELGFDVPELSVESVYNMH